MTTEKTASPIATAPVEAPKQFDRPQLGTADLEVDSLIRASEARRTFEVDGSGLTVAVLDTGLRVTHVDFAGRVAAQRNFTDDNGGDPNDVTDRNGHATNVAGIIVADGIHHGIAPGARVVPLKVLGNNGSGSFQAIADALQWVLDHRTEHDITTVCMSLGDGQNYQSDEIFAEDDTIHEKLRALRDANIAVGVAAGNDFFRHDSEQGMSYPAILRGSVSVGAVYDAVEGGFSYGDGSEAFSTGPDRITPFSQRLHKSVNKHCRTDIFGPGAPVTSSGIENDRGESVQHGTSQAAPVTVGVILLMQELYLRATGRLPKVDDLAAWLRLSGVSICDGDDEDDNVDNTDVKFIRIDAFGALETLRRHLRKELFLTGRSLKAA